MENQKGLVSEEIVAARAQGMYDVVVIGGGQAGLSVGYYLRRRTNLSFIILDSLKTAGGAWLRGWDSLSLFSPAQSSSLPGWMFPGAPGRYPTRDETTAYLTEYEQRYQLPLARPIKAVAVRPVGGGKSGADLIVEGIDQQTRERTTWQARAVVSATGSWEKPFVPNYPGQVNFAGLQIHSGFYRSPEQFAGQTVLVVGAGNSGAQIMAEVSLFANATWVTLADPKFLPDEIDGQVLFNQASEKYRQLVQGACGVSGAEDQSKPLDPLGNIVMVESVKAARDRGALHARRPFVRFKRDGVIWEDNSETTIDAVIWCTGFRPALDHLRPLGVVEDDNRVIVSKTRSTKEPRLWLVGYGNWTGFASATLIGVGRTARQTVEEISATLS